MLASSERVRTCRALLCFSSSGRVTTRLPSWLATLMVAGTVSSRPPLGPSEVVCWCLTVTFAFPTGTGFFPILLMAFPSRRHGRSSDHATVLADGAKQFATDVLLARLAV